jgi:hypothetical protein
MRRDPASAFRTVDVTPFRRGSALSETAMRGDPWSTETDRQDWSWAAPTLWGRGTVLNLDPDRGDLYRLESLRRVSGSAALSPRGDAFFSAIGLRFAVRYRDAPPLPGFRRFGGDAFRDWDENPLASPDLRLLERWREEPDSVGSLRALGELSGGEVVVESGDRRSGAARPGAIRVVEKSPERLVVDVEASDPTWLFVLRGYWTHRRIRRDGIEAAAVPAQLAFSAVAVPAGRHRLEWEEEAPGLSASRWGPALFALAAGGLLAPRAGAHA